MPKLLQAPCVLPPLFPFSKTTIYLLMSSGSNQNTPADKVILRGNSLQGPLELEIPVQQLDLPGKKLHQLAAKKAIQELEGKRGWLLNVKKEDDTPLKDRYPSCYGEMVQREAVRLGVQYQITGKYCSSVAVADNAKNSKEVEVCPPAYRRSFIDPPSEGYEDSDEDMDFGLLGAPTTRSAGPTTRRHAFNQHQASGRGNIGIAGRGSSGSIPISSARSQDPLTSSLPPTSAKPAQEIGKRKTVRALGL
ncbi:hypothetical protein N7G274_006386 [Stereocaulon virgatum]|uniref:Uncharacterized protein n=1 Tax=Stereocaulon virgatum TaxID=373712 RepID=A0ABR4AC45_9LECA